MSSIINATTTAGVTVTGDNSGLLQLATNNGTTAVTIDTSQNVGIGTTSPNSYFSGGTNLVVGNASGNTGMTISSGSSSLGRILFADGTSGAEAYQGWVYYTHTDNAMSFATSASERMRIDSSGNLLVGATSTVSSAQLYVTGSVADRFIRFNNSQPSAPFGVVITYSAAAPNDTGKSFLFCADNSATRADIRSNGGLANYSANNVNLSDAREKTNVELAGNYLSKICSIPVKTFNYIDQNREDDDGLTLGVIAQDVQAIAPELVTESDWGTEDNPKMRLSIYQTDLQYALMKAIQELKAELDATKAEVQALKGTL